MTQNRLKLLIILSNLLETHLSYLDRNLTSSFVIQLVTLINSDENQYEHIYHQIKSKIPKSNLEIPFGFNLLLELTYIFIVQCKSEVVPTQLKNLIMIEYCEIMKSLVTAQNLFYQDINLDKDMCFTKITKDQFQTYFGHKRRKMNL